MNLPPKPESAPRDARGAAPNEPAPVYTGPAVYYGAAYYGPSAGAFVEPGAFGELTLRRISHVVRKKWVTLAAALLFGVIAAFFYILTASKTYRASSLIELSVRRPRIAGQQGALLDDSYSYVQSEEILNTRLEKFKSRTMLDLAMANLRAATNLTEWADKDLREMLQKSASIVLIRRSHLVQITFEHWDPAFAALGVNAFSDAAEKLAAEENKTASDNAVTWLHTQAAVQRTALEKADEALAAFRSENKVDTLESRKKTVDESLLDFSKALTSVEGEEVMARDMYDSLAKLDVRPENAGKLPAGVPRAAEIQAMLEKWMDAVSQRDALLSKYTEKHPEVVAQAKVIDVLRSQTTEAIQRAKQTATSNLKLLEQQGRSLRKKIEEQRKLSTELEMHIIDLNSKQSALERGREAADISYKGILNRIEEARLSADENTATVKIVERAIPPERPVKPRKVVVLFMGLLVGMCAGLGLALWTDALEDHVNSTEDLERGLGMRILGLIPRVEDVAREDLALLSMSDKFSHVAEAFAGVRSVLDSAQYKDVSGSVLIASTAPEEGKTIAACNLAIMSAKSGRRTLLLDFDMRRSRLGQIFKVPEEDQVLVTVLKTGNANLFSKLPVKTSCENLEVIASRLLGGVSPTEIIGGGAVDRFLEWAIKTYDRVIIDSPPFGIVSDSAVLAGLVSCVIMVCRFNRSRKRALRHAVRHFVELGANVVGVIVNDVDFNKEVPFSGYDQYYSAYNVRVAPKQPG